MHILITGIHGFVGTNLVSYLSSKYSIYGLDIISPQKEGVIKTYLWTDLENNIIPEVDIIIHLAGKAHDTSNKSASDIYFKVNTELTKKIFDWYLNSKTAKKFIFFSTAKAAAETVPNVLKEDILPTPVGPYGESKIQAENYIKQKCNIELGNIHEWNSINGKDVYIFRPCMIHGPGNKGNLNLLFKVVSKGIPWPLGSFNNLRTFTSIENLCFIIDMILTKQIKSGIYNIGDDDAISTNKLIDIICKVLNKKTRILHIPKLLISFCAKIGDILHLPFNTFRMKKLTENYISDNSKIKKALGINELPIKAEDGLRRTIKSFQKI